MNRLAPSPPFLLGMALALLTVFLPAAPARADRCDDLRREYREVRQRIAEIEAAWRRERGRQTEEAEDEIQEALDEIKEIMEAGGQASDIAEKIEEAAERLSREGTRLREFLEGVQGGLEGSGELFEKVSDAIERLERLQETMGRVRRMLEANPENPMEAAEAFQAGFEMMNDILGPLIERVPGLSEWMEFYTEAVKAIVGKMREIRAARSRASVAALGEDIFDPRTEEVARLRARLRAIEAAIERECRGRYAVLDGRVVSWEVYQAEMAEREAARAAAEAEAARRRRCEEIVRESEDLRRRGEDLQRRARSLGDAARAAGSAEEAGRIGAEAGRLKREAEEADRRADALDEEARRLPCDDAVRTATRGAQAATGAAVSGASSAEGTAVAVGEFVRAAGDCDDCRERLRAAIAEAEATARAIEAARARLDDVRRRTAEIDRRADEIRRAWEETGQDVTHYYETPAGELVGAANFAGEHAGTMRYVGWVMNRGASRRRNEWQREQDRLKADRERLEREAGEIEREIEALRARLERQREEIERIRRACEECEDALAARFGWLGDATVVRRHRDATAVDTPPPVPDLPPGVAPMPPAPDTLFARPRTIPRGTEEWDQRSFSNGAAPTGVPGGETACRALAGLSRRGEVSVVERWIAEGHTWPTYVEPATVGRGEVEADLAGPAATAAIEVRAAAGEAVEVLGACLVGNDLVESVLVVYGPNPRPGARPIETIEGRRGTFRAPRAGRYVVVVNAPGLAWNRTARASFTAGPAAEAEEVARPAARPPDDEDAERRRRRSAGILLDAIGGAIRDEPEEERPSGGGSGGSYPEGHYPGDADGCR